MDTDTMKAGLLMEAAEAHQQLAGAALKRLDAATRGLEPAVRDAVEQAVAATVRAELTQVRSETQRTAQALQTVRDKLSWNVNLTAYGVAVIGAITAVGVLVLLGWLDAARAPQPVAPLLNGSPATLTEIERQRVRVDVTLCGPERQPCVRIDPKSGTYNQRRETYVLLPPK